MYGLYCFKFVFRLWGLLFIWFKVVSGGEILLGLRLIVENILRFFLIVIFYFCIINIVIYFVLINR